MAFSLTAAACGSEPGPDESAEEVVVSAQTANNGLAFNGINWNGISWNGIAWNGFAFNGMSFNGMSWNGMAFNGMSWNGISFNGMSFNGMAWNGISFNGMSWNGMSWNGISFNGLASEPVNELVRYIVSCALPKGDSITFEADGTKYTFEGEIGVAPEWKTKACDTSCQRWVSACLLARINFAGAHVQISMRGENKGLAVQPHEMRDFKIREATYYGNVFDGGGETFACLSPGQTNIERVCGPNLEGCPMNVVGSCADYCRGTGKHEGFRDCGTEALSKSGSKTDRAYGETITVFLAK